MLILSHGVTRESIGRLTAVIDSMKKVVTLNAPGGAALDAREFAIMQKYLRYHHPEIINPHGLATGWTITGELEVQI
jgi:hypothetical protein